MAVPSNNLLVALALLWSLSLEAGVPVTGHAGAVGRIWLHVPSVHRCAVRNRGSHECWHWHTERGLICVCTQTLSQGMRCLALMAHLLRGWAWWGLTSSSHCATRPLTQACLWGLGGQGLDWS